MLLSLTKKWKRRVLDTLYPLHCPACRSGLPEGAVAGDFCRSCTEVMVPVEPPFCQQCAEPFMGEITGDFTCPNCAGMKLAFDFTVCLWLSRGPVREAVHRLKYEKFRTGRLALARLMLPALEDSRLAGMPWLLVPVPLHASRERERTYNQSAEIARTVARLAGIEWAPALRRTRKTESQAGLNRAARLKNLRGAFAVRSRCARLLQSRSILLVDDVLTTGATAHECAQVLKKAGASRVAVLTAARG